MELCVIGDIHCNYKRLKQIMSETKSDLYLQVGDLSDSKFKTPKGLPSLQKPLYFIQGNHELYKYIEPFNNQNKNRAYRIRKNLYYIPLGGYADIKGLRVLGFGGNYGASVYCRKRSNLKIEQCKHFTQYDFLDAMRVEDVDILLTHEVPCPYEWRGGIVGSPFVSNLIMEKKPKYHFCGHMHTNSHYKILDTESYCVNVNNYVLVEV